MCAHMDVCTCTRVYACIRIIMCCIVCVCLSINYFAFLLQEQLPFAVVGSRDEVVVGGSKVRARKYPWGTVEGE